MKDMGDREIRIAIAGVGNCACALLQGIALYASDKELMEEPIGLMHYDLGGYKPGDIKVVAAFDIDARKVGKPLREAILPSPIAPRSSIPMSLTTR